MNQELIYKYLKGDTSSVENGEILQWIEARKDNRKQFMQYRRLYDATIWIESSHRHEQPMIKRNKQVVILKKWMQIAAIIAIAITGTLFLQQQLTAPEQIYTQTVEVPLGQRVNMTLSDGTRVSLNSNSKLHFPSTFIGKKREVILDGEGFFEVAHDATRPFHVVTEKYDIKVLGTTFNVLAYNNSEIFETSLLEGSVSIEEKKSKQSTLLQPNNKVSLKENKLIASKLDTEDDFLWRKGIYVFKNESLTDVFKKLEQYYQVQIIVKNQKITTHKCTGKFSQKEGIEHILRVLQKINDFEYQRDDESNIITIL